MNPNFDKLIQAIPGAVCLFRIKPDGHCEILYLSDGVRDLYEYTPAEGYANHCVLMNCILEEDRPSVFLSLEDAARQGLPWLHEYRIQTPSGKTKWIRGHARPEREVDGSVLWRGILTDVSSSKATEIHLRRIQKLYAAAIETGRVIARARSAVELLFEVCKIAVELGGMKMAWIGIQRKADKQLMPIAKYGDGTDYLDKVVISTRSDIPEGQGPTGVAYREGRAIIINDFQGNPVTHPWLEQANHYGWQSSASFPIPDRGIPYAVLNVYSAETDAFDSEEITLLEQLASDVSRAISVLSDLAESQQMEQELAESEKRFSLFMDTLPAAAFIKDEDGRVLYANRYMFDNLGVRAWLGKSARDFFPPEVAEEMIADDRRALETGYIVNEEEVPHVDGQVRLYQTYKFRISQPQQPPLLGGIALDITERKQMEDQIRYLAYFDSLTNLPNRRMLLDRLVQALRRAKRYECSLALMFLDLDNFKKINDILGHDIGDELLKEVATRLRASVRAVDTVSRHGGDEFIILLPEISHPDDVTLVADKIIKTINAPVQIAGNALNVTTSIGIAVYPINGTDDARELMKKADKAMYAAKDAGRNSYKFFDSEFI